MNTEEKLKKIAAHLLFVEGRFSVTTQQIAQIAGLDRTAIHYYFRTKGNLVNVIISEAIIEFPAPSWDEIKGLSLKEKIKSYIDYNTGKSRKYPYLDIYILTRNEPSFWQHLFFPLTEMLPEIAVCIRQGKTTYSEPIQFLIDLVSLVSGFYITVNFFQKHSEIVLSPHDYYQRTERIISLFLE